jgi:hypothetical protein
MDMKLKNLLIMLAVVAVLGTLTRVLSSGKAAQPTYPSPPAQIITTSPSPQPTPKRALKPNEQFIAPVGLYITIPDGMTFRKEIADDAGIIRSVGFYIENNKGYQLYGLYQDKVLTERGLDEAKKEMDKDSINEASVGGFKGIEGLIVGQRARFNTIVIKDGKTLSFSTIPATEENIEITRQIMSKISFE